MMAQGERVAAQALSWVGTPYRHQGSRKGVGCDCLGLVRGVWRELCGQEPEAPGAYQPDWAETGHDRLLDAARRHCREREPGRIETGDIVLFRWRSNMNAKHCGIIVGPDRFVHAYEGHSVMISHLVPSWRRRIAGVFIFPDLPASD